MTGYPSEFINFASYLLRNYHPLKQKLNDMREDVIDGTAFPVNRSLDKISSSVDGISRTEQTVMMLLFKKQISTLDELIQTVDKFLDVLDEKHYNFVHEYYFENIRKHDLETKRLKRRCLVLLVTSLGLPSNDA